MKRMADGSVQLGEIMLRALKWEKRLTRVAEPGRGDPGCWARTKRYGHQCLHKPRPARMTCKFHAAAEPEAVLLRQLLAGEIKVVNKAGEVVSISPREHRG